MRKKLFSLFLLVFAGFVLVACNNDKVDLEAVRDETYAAVFKGSDTEASVTQDLVFKTTSDKHKDIVIAWTTSDATVVSNTGVVVRQSEDKKVTISFEVKYNKEKVEKEFEVTVKKAETPIPEDKFSITLPEHVTASKATDIASGTEVTLTVTPPTGKVLDKLTVDGTDVTAQVVNNKYTFKVTKNIIVLATFKDAPVVEEVIIYQTGFEASEEYVAGTTYNNQEEVLTGPVGKQFAILSGSPTTSYPLDGDQSIQVRYYAKSAADTFGYIRSNFALENITQIRFNAANSAGNSSAAQNYKILVEVSADGTTWSNGKSYTLTGDNTEYSYENTLATAKYFKFTLELGEGTHIDRNQGFAIDEIKVFSTKDESPSVNVTFDEGYTDAPTNVVPVKVGDKVNKPGEDPVREGYTFVNWVKEGQTETYDFSQTVEEPFTLVAQWEIKKVVEEEIIYQTGFEASEGYVAGTSYNNQEEKLAGPVEKQFAILSGSPTTSYPLDGDQSIQVRYYAKSAADTFGYIRSNFALENIVEIRFNAANSAGNSSGAQNYKILVEVSADGTTWSNGKSYTLTGDNTEYSYENTLATAKYFKFTLELGEGTHSDKNQGFAIDEIKVFNTKDERPSVNVTFDEGYTDAPTNVVPVKVGDKVNKPGKDPVREGYTFVNWVKEGQTEIYDFSQNVEEAFKLVAQWEIKKFDITVTGEGLTIDSVKDLPYGTEVVVTIAAPEGKVLDKLTVDGVEVTVTENTYKFNIKKATTIDVTYTLVEFEIEYNLNGGDNYLAAPETYNVETEYVFGTPLFGNREFLGWFSDAEFTEEVNGIELGTTGELVLYAKWGAEVLTSVTVTNEADFVAALLNEEVTTINVGANITLTESLEVNAREGLTINGHGFTLDMATTDGWNGNYLIKVWNSTDIFIENITLNGGDVALLVNSSTVKVEKITLTHNEFGGIEVSRSADEELMLPKLTVVDILEHELADDVPVVWIDKQDNNANELVVFDVENGLETKAYEEDGKTQYWFFVGEKQVEESVVSIKNTRSSGNMGTGNEANNFGIDNNVFDVRGIKGTGGQNIGYASSEIRLYYGSGSNGNTFSLKMLGDQIITGIKINFSGKTGDAKITIGSFTEVLTGGTIRNKQIEYKDLNSNSFTVQNVNSSNTQLRITSFEVTYLG